MRKKSKIQIFIEQVSEAIRERRVGFLDRLPSRRELAKEFNLSPGSVQIALNEMERLGIVVNTPQKGSRVNREKLSVITPKSTDFAPLEDELLSITVFETMPHQTEFWLNAFRIFELKNPNCTIKSRFSDAKNAESSKDIRVAIRIPENFQATVSVPIREIFEHEKLEKIKKSILSQFENWNWSINLPYQFQTFACLCSSSKSENLIPEFGEKIASWVNRCYKSFGEKSLLPPNITWLSNACGVTDMAENHMLQLIDSPELSDFFETLAFYAQKDLINHEIDVKDTYNINIEDDPIKALIVFSHHWSHYQNQLNNSAKIIPLPFSANANNQATINSAMILGDKAVSCIEKRFFEFLISDEFQLLQMKHQIGLSPYNHILTKAVTEIPELSDLIRRIHTHPFRIKRLRRWPELELLLEESVILPLLVGELTSEEAIKKATPIIQDFCKQKNTATKQKLKSFLRVT